MVLRVGPPPGEHDVRGRPVLQPERRRPDEVDLRPGSRPAGLHRHPPAGHQRPPHVAGAARSTSSASSTRTSRATSFGDRATVSPESANYFKFDTSDLIDGELAVAGHQPAAARRAAGDPRRGALQLGVARRSRRASGARSSPSPSRAGSIPGLLYRGAGQAAGPTFIFAAMSAPNIWEPRGIGHLRDRRARVQGRLRQLAGARQDLLERDIHSATSYRFNNGVPNQITHARHAGEPLRRPEGRARHLRAGQVDDRPADAERRAALRLLQHLLPRDAPRPRPARADPQPHDSRRTTGTTGRTSRRASAPSTTCSATARRRSRSTSAATSLAGDPTVGNAVLEPGQHGDAVVDDRRPSIDGDFVPDCDLAEPSGQRRVRHHLRPALRPAGPEHGLRPGRARRLGQARLQLGVLDRRAARARRRASASTSATSAASTATSRSPTTGPWPRPTTARSASPRRPIRGCPDGGGYPVSGLLRPQPEQGRPGRQLRHLRRQLRQADRALERHGLHRERAPAARASCCRAASAPAGRRPTTATSATVLPDDRRAQPVSATSTPTFLTQVKLLGTYTVPKVDVQVGGDVPEPARPAGRRPTTSPPTRRSSRRSAGRCRAARPT